MVDTLASPELMDILERVDEEALPPQAVLGGVESELKRLLSIGGIVPDSSSLLAERQVENSLAYTKIGAGACGAVYAQEGKSVVLKLLKDKGLDLWNDYLMHTIVLKAAQVRAVDIQIPKCYFFENTDSEFCRQNPGLVQAAEKEVNLPTRVLATQRINPLSEAIRHALINKYCPESIKTAARRDPANRDCLVRVYLGKQGYCARPQRMFSLRNFKLSLDDMIELQLDVVHMAKQMGQTLSLMHWAAKTNARDVEFVLGSSTEKHFKPKTEAELDAMPPNTRTGPTTRVIEDFFHRKTELWLLDFNQVQKIEFNDDSGLDDLLHSHKINDPYYPKPCQWSAAAKSVWNSFATAYIQMATRVLAKEKPEVRALPLLFITGLINAEKERQAVRGNNTD